MSEGDLVDLVRAEQEKPAWTAAQFAEELYHQYGWQLVACIRDPYQFAGYICCRAVAGEAEILKIAVTEPFRRQGVGALLLGKAIDRMVEEKVTRCYLEVRDSNHIAKSLYEKYGFRQIGHRKGYYISPREDAIVYKLSLAKS
jgi:ribosomal-protein-alanine N-acetyltransferase